MNHPKIPPVDSDVELRPGYWVACNGDGQVIACCKTPQELDEAVIHQGESPERVMLYQVPFDDEGAMFGGVELEF